MDFEIIFNTDNDAASIYVRTVFPAEVANVWAYFSEREKLDQWWGPKPWHCETQELEFREGGVWRYAMVSPAGEKHFAGAKFHEITTNRSFDRTDYFCDVDGLVDKNMSERKWLVGFTGVQQGTKVTFNIHFQNETEMQKLLEMGFEGGFKIGLRQLHEIFLPKNPLTN
ncbi:SRPBCC family protein [Kaistella palustris]|uniref:SRPBCC family protein n=1 Tax=Kaistella palustris TaxID=493376 RepID=UPI0003FBF9E2|nr:SRPBCC domain-containing protein [Kaistella palustris]